MSDTDVQPERTIWDQPNTVFPQRPGYQKPDYRVDPEHHFPLTASAVQVDGTVVEKAHAAIMNGQTQFEKHLSTIESADYTPEGMAKRIAEFTRTDAAKAVDVAVDSVRDRRDKAAAQVERIFRDLSPDGDAAQEARNTRYWQQCCRILDNIKDVARVDSVAKDMLAKADRNQLGVLLQELQPYVQARLEVLDSPRAKERILDGYSKSVDQAVDKIVPEYSRAKTQLQKATQAAQIVEHNARSLRARFTGNAYSTNFAVDPRKYDPDH